MKINWDKVRWIVLCVLFGFFASAYFTEYQQRKFWEAKAEERRLDAKYYEIKYDYIYSRNVELQQAIINCYNSQQHEK